MAKKTTKPAAGPPLDPRAFAHVSKEERFLLFVAPALGTARAARCLTLDVAKAAEVWAEIGGSAMPVNLD